MRHQNYDVIVAWAEGKPIQYRFVSFDSDGTWFDYINTNLEEGTFTGVSPRFQDPSLNWRIKPKTVTVRYRLALIKRRHNGDYDVMACKYSDQDYVQEVLNTVESSPSFMRWLGGIHEVVVEDEDEVASKEPESDPLEPFEVKDYRNQS